ncbi:MAG TPA: hypothetical protein VLN25_03180 [Burkholderiaceae bacterium]|nr:hypothetical protein [Burkholderiaceae bacterium]
MRTWVVLTKTFIGAWETRSKSTLSARMSRSGLLSRGLRSYGENTRAARSIATKIGE